MKSQTHEIQKERQARTLNDGSIAQSSVFGLLKRFVGLQP